MTTELVEASHVVIIVVNQDIPKTLVGSYMVSPLIGKQQDHHLNVKVMGSWPQETIIHTFEATLFSKEQMDLLQKMFSQSQPSPTTPIIGTGSIAQKGNSLSALSIKTEKPSS